MQSNGKFIIYFAFVLFENAISVYIQKSCMYITNIKYKCALLLLCLLYIVFCCRVSSLFMESVLLLAFFSAFLFYLQTIYFRNLYIGVITISFTPKLQRHGFLSGCSRIESKPIEKYTFFFHFLLRTFYWLLFIPI